MDADNLTHLEIRIHVNVWERSTERLDGKHITDDALQEKKGTRSAPYPTACTTRHVYLVITKELRNKQGSSTSLARAIKEANH